MKNNRSLISFAIIVSGLCVLLSFSWAKGQELPGPDVVLPPVASSPYADCPALPGQGPGGQITVYVVKIPAQPGFVCARAVNGLRSSLDFKGFSLQQRDGDEFRDYTEPMPPLPPGFIIGETLAHHWAPPGYWLDRRLPSYNPAPAGTYRACFRYTLMQSSPARQEEACSEAFTLP